MGAWDWKIWAVFVGGGIIIIAFFFGVSLDWDGKKLSFRPRGKDKKKDLPCHATCIHVGDIMSVIARTSEYVETKSSAPNLLIEIQMRYFEEKELELQGRMQKVFISAVADKLKVHDGVIGLPDYKTYQLILAEIRQATTDYYRVAMRQNHIAELVGDEWFAFKNRRKTAIIQMVTDLFNDLWFGTILTREELYRVHLAAKMPELAESFCSEVFEFAKAESIKSAAKVEDSKVAYETFLREKVVGDSVLL